MISPLVYCYMASYLLPPTSYLLPLTSWQPMISPLVYYYMAWRVIPNATELLKMLLPHATPPNQWPNVRTTRLLTLFHCTAPHAAPHRTLAHLLFTIPAPTLLTSPRYSLVW